MLTLKRILFAALFAFVCIAALAICGIAFFSAIFWAAFLTEWPVPFVLTGVSVAVLFIMFFAMAYSETESAI